MARGESSGIPDSLTLFCARLRRLQRAVGITQTSLAGAAHLGTSQMSDILGGKIKRLPDWNVTAMMVGACLEYAEKTGRPVPPDLCDEGDWRRRYSDLEHDLDTAAEARPPREAAAGWALADVSDPFALEVHRAVQPDIPQPGLPVLPVYVPREHDTELASIVEEAAQGSSRIAVLVGGSSTGKTRACWQALQLLRDRTEPWRLWHPIDPSRPEAALRELPSIGRRTVVWLNEAQFYLDVSSGLGERIAAGLRELLRNPARAPVLVLATLWPQFWDKMTVRPQAGAGDLHAQARELLSGWDISVPATFTGRELQWLADAGDPRLVQAAGAAENGQVIQFLAGAPELMARYRNAPPAAAALTSAAMDARRLGMGIALPMAFLEAAAPGYLTDTEWDGLGEDWLEQALAYTAAPCKGVGGPLARTQTRPLRTVVPFAGSACRLADYLDQHGRRGRRYVPPSDFWAAAARFADPGDLSALADAAEAGGLLRDAARLRKRAIAHGDTSAAATFVERWHSLHLHPSDESPAWWVAGHAALDDAGAVGSLLEALRKGGAEEQAAALLARGPAAHAALDDPHAVASLLEALRNAGAEEQADVLADRAAAHAALDDPGAVGSLLEALRKGARKNRLRRCSPAAPPPTPPSMIRVPSPRCWKRCGTRARKNRPTCWRTARPLTLPSMTRAPSARCWKRYGRGARKNRLRRCSPAAPPPTPPSMTVARTPSPGCWKRCGTRARKNRPTCWRTARLRMLPSMTRSPSPGYWKSC